MLCIKLQCINEKTLIKCLFAGTYLLSSDACALPRTSNCESNGCHAGEEPPSSACKNISALLNTCYTHLSWVSLPQRVTPLSSAFGKGLGLAVIGVYGQGETEAQSGNSPTPEACEHNISHLPGQSCMPQTIGYALISSLLLFVQQFSLIAFILCLFKLIL